jgi:uncharacterized protein (DUF58 family)
MPNNRNAVYMLITLSLVAGLLTGRAFFFNIAYLFGSLLVIAYIWAWGSVRWLRISRKTRARRAQVGRNMDEVFTVRNIALLPKLWLEVHDQSELPGHKASHVVPAIWPRGQYRWYVQTTCTARGEYRLGPMTLKSGDPFGLYESPRKIGATSNIIVYPKIVTIPRFVLPAAVLSGGEPQRQRSHNVTTNASGVREYVPGDSYNRIHWRSTARRQMLMVKEFELDPLVDIHLFVDLSATSLHEAPSVQRLRNGEGPIISDGRGIAASTEEYTVVIAASLAKYFVDIQRALGFSAYTPARVFYEGDRGERHLTRILQTLATARSRSPYTLGQMLTLETPHFARGATVIIITSSLNTAWVTEAQIMARRGTKPMCVFVDPTSFGAPGDTDELLGLLQMSRIPTLRIRYNDDLSLALSQQPL